MKDLNKDCPRTYCGRVSSWDVGSQADQGGGPWGTDLRGGMEGGVTGMQSVPPEEASWGPVSGGHPEPGLEAAGGGRMVSS